MKTRLILVILLNSLIASAQQNVKLQVISESDRRAIPAVDIILVNKKDTSYVVDFKVTDKDGFANFVINEIGSWKFKIFSLGFITSNVDILNILDTIQLPTIILKEDVLLIKEITITANRKNINMDHISLTFNHEQIKRAKNASELMLNIPHIYYNKIQNSISATDGTPILILINGIISRNEDLKLIPPDKVKRIEYYNVPTVRYAGNGKVLSVTTRDLDNGWAGDFYLNTSGFSSMFTPIVSHINGNQKFSLSYSLFENNLLNNKRDKIEKTWKYSLDDKEYIYQVSQDERDFIINHNIDFTYSISKDKDYSFQIKGNFGFSDIKYNANKYINLSIDKVIDDKNGFLDSKTNSIAPIIDLYYSKIIKSTNYIDLNVVLQNSSNKQDVYSYEGGINSFEENMNSNFSKTTLIGEIAYSGKLLNSRLSSGYRYIGWWSNNELTNSLYNKYRYTDNLNSHFIYAELSRRISKFSYRVSLGGNYIHNNGRQEVQDKSQFIFSPRIMLGYSFNNNNMLSINYNSGVTTPSTANLSNTSVFIMNGIIKTGNPNLQSSTKKEILLSYSRSHNEGIYDIDIALNYKNNKRLIFYTFEEREINGNKVIALFPSNASLDSEFGITTSITTQPFKGMRIGDSGSILYQSFKSNKQQSKDKFQNKSIAQSKIDIIENCRLVTKESTYGLSISWSFNTSKKRFYERRKIDNHLESAESFNLK